jgi:cell division transport system ATP-binding protein
VVEFESVAFAYGPVEVLRDVSFAVAPGAFCVVYGEAGAGKTTLLRLARGEIAPTAGVVRVLGAPVPAADRAAVAALRRRIGVLAEDGFLDHLSLRDNLAAPLAAEGTLARRAADVDALIAWLGLARRAEDPPARLTEAERRRAALGRALINGAELILADEPTRTLGEEEGEDILRRLVELNGMGRTVLALTGRTGVATWLGEAARGVRFVHLAGGATELAA